MEDAFNLQSPCLHQEPQLQSLHSAGGVHWSLPPWPTTPGNNGAA